MSLCRWLKRVLRIHIDIPSVVVILLIISLVYRPLVAFIVPTLEDFAARSALPPTTLGFVRDVFSPLCQHEVRQPGSRI